MAYLKQLESGLTLCVVCAPDAECAGHLAWIAKVEDWRAGPLKLYWAADGFYSYDAQADVGRVEYDQAGDPVFGVDRMKEEVAPVKREDSDCTADYCAAVEQAIAEHLIATFSSSPSFRGAATTWP